jgi:hypothetical protein
MSDSQLELALKVRELAQKELKVRAEHVKEFKQSDEFKELVEEAKKDGFKKGIEYAHSLCSEFDKIKSVGVLLAMKHSIGPTKEELR